MTALFDDDHFVIDDFINKHFLLNGQTPIPWHSSLCLVSLVKVSFGRMTGCRCEFCICAGGTVARLAARSTGPTNNSGSLVALVIALVAFVIALVAPSPGLPPGVPVRPTTLVALVAL